MYHTHILRSRFRGAAASTSWSTLGPQAQPAHQAKTRFHAHFLKTAPLLSRPLSGWSWSTTRTGGGPPLRSSEKLAGRTCMITGGTSGIGFAIAERFLQEGAKRIILVGRSHERLVKAASRLEAPTSGNAFAGVQSSSDSIVGEVATKAPETDQQPRNKDTQAKSHGTLIDSSSRISLLVGDISEAGKWLRELEKAMQPVDILVNAAGISISNILPKLEPDDISRVLRTNLEGAMLTSRALVRASIRRGTGAVPYAASKAGILGLTRSLAVEAAHSLRGVVIRSNAIVPGYIETPMIADFSEGETSRLKESIPVRRFGTPHEIADAAVFLAQNEYANNCVLNLDGGLSAS
ncbi:SDR family NAD(P)-dependent oxidoreductase [Aspergillus novofumigatus IBT 16806]|uniref:3-oxoacyl-acyl carrier protein reductase n=1 Tax=Aspergillus novofumigatus (strain IBT 16806) TaxID=1392255 RepID=A0A2I1CCD8_ASPN1|nr:3-oxoacyl-acyl carrier protein reductase [Aspergillus novofumigatus IBT 16806]PKX95292.1 3-oxoacyl-acyl carrier protein reductase [Aspergillus novofumigatus IBT 16806]